MGNGGGEEESKLWRKSGEEGKTLLITNMSIYLFTSLIQVIITFLNHNFFHQQPFNLSSSLLIVCCN